MSTRRHVHRWTRARAPVALVSLASFLLAQVPLYARAEAITHAVQNEHLDASEAPQLNAAREALRDVAQAPDPNAPSSPPPATPLSLPFGGERNGVSNQTIHLPQGGGKVEGMGESFSMQLSTGVATYSIPFRLPSARGGAQPQLALSFSSAAGPGVAGLGWALSVPFIARQTDRGVPKYKDDPFGGGWHPEQDRFVFNGGQELVPICQVKGGACAGAQSGEVMPAWASGWQYFRPRVEGAFLRFFWSPDRTEWRVQGKAGDTMILGGDAGAREADPNHPGRIFSWRLSRHHDARTDAQGRPVNVVVYRYLQDGGVLYLSDVYDTPPADSAATAPLSSYAHHTRLIYQPRADVISSYRRGWETKSALRLSSVDVTSKTDSAGAPRELVRRYHLAYEDILSSKPVYTSLLAHVWMEGRCAQPIAENSNEELPRWTTCPTLPPMTFEYLHVEGYAPDGRPTAAPDDGFEPFDARLKAMANSPQHAVHHTDTGLFDMDADGLPDVLVTDPAGHRVFFNGPQGQRDTFGGAQALGIQPVLGESAQSLLLKDWNVAPLDLDGDGTIDLVRMPPGVGTYSVYTAAPGAWKGRAVALPPGQLGILKFGSDAPRLRSMDVDGDGLVDLVFINGHEVQTFFALGRYPGGDGKFGHATWTGPDTASLSTEPVHACLPYITAGAPVRFDDPNWPIEIADMNGDGLPDLVYVYKGWIRYWPGRGNGHFGTETNPPATGACGTEGAIRMPELAQHTKNPVRLDDVSGDGLDDLVEFGETSSGGIVSVWLNKGGASWTPVRAIVGTPSRAPGLDYGANVRLVDIDGSGTRDILWGDGLRYRYLDLLGGRRPRLLTKIHNGLGKTTELEYASSTELMLAAEASGKPWATKMPIAAHVVTRVTERDNLEKIGRPAGVYTTEYSYRDPIYEGRQREFRGFREVTAKRLGDANSPTSLASSTFLLGECKEDCGPESRWKDNPREVLKGLPVVTESFDEQGTYLSTTHHKYRLRRLYLGLDGRDVWHAFAREEDTWAYDTAPFVASASSLTITDVEIEDDPKALWTGASLRPDLDRTLALRSSAGRVRLQSRVAVDPWGNTREKTAEGCIEGCPARDEQITSYAAPNLVPEPGGWMWRTGTSFVMGTASSTQRNLTSFTYDSAGAPVFVTKTIEGGLPLDRFHEDPTKAIAPTPASAILNGVAVTQLVYDTFGNLRFERGRDARCRAVTFDQAFADLPVTETIYAGTAQDGCGTTLLTTLASFDRGLEAITSAHGVNGELTLASYDAFGRVTAISKPSAASVGMIATRPSVRIDYDLPTAARPFTRVHVQTHDGQADTDDSYRHAYSSIDGLGRTIVAIEQADLSAGDGGQWIVRGLGDYDAKGAPKRQHLAWFWSGDPLAFPLASSAPTAFARARFDAFGRTVQAFGLDGAITLETRYHALSEEAWDAADLAPGPHQGTYASVRKDGHGRTVETTERVRVSGALEERHVTTSYLPTGEPTMITRRRGSDTYVRWMRRDSLGRIVLNVEPSTTKGFSADPSTAPTAMKAWRYAYNASGDLVGTSDARGCGQNFHYEAAGRLLAEDYSPCLASHADYTPPNLVTGEGTEVFLRYDSVDPDWTSVIMADPAFGTFPTLYMGRLASVSDRGQKTLTRYDARGRATGIAKKVAKPEAPAASPAQRYAPRWYTQTATFDEADRPFAETTGAQVQELLGAGGQSSVSIEYSKRDTVKKVTSSYGELIGSIVREADGPIAKIIYGDLAKTTTEMSFDLRRRLSSVQTYRGPPSLWSSPTYVPAIDGTTTQLLLEDTDFKYDLVDNPVEIQDHRLASEWPSGAKPASRKIHYDDVYRVTKVEHLYAASDDTWVSPFTSENAGAIDPRRAKPSPHVAFAKRVLSQTFEYDWLGNTTRTTDDAAGFYDRSLGAIANAGYQLRAATGLTSSRDGSLTAAYDDAGYLTSLAVLRNGGCIPAGSVCSQRFAYEWDEVGRLVRARRWDIAAPGSATDPLPQGAPAAELRHVYDGADQRVVKTATDAQGSAVHTVYVFESLELRRARWDGTEFERTAWTEVPYLFAHGVRLARVHWAENDVPNAQSGGLHVLFLLPDHLGSSSIVVDKDTSELVERSSYQAYGAAENDYRPSRWDSFREDYRFTGKEDDAETGLQYFGKRFYAPNLGRWTSPDPLAVHSPLAADLNVYAYVSGRAFTWIDPTGLEADSPFEAPGRPGEQPFWFFLGHAAHWIIARDYKHARASMPNKVFTNTVPVKTILKESRIGDHTALTEREAAIRPDVTDTHDGVVGEIKPDTALGRQKGREQLAEQLAALNKTLKDTDQKFVAMQNYSGERVVAFAGGKYVWRLTWKTDNGVILYKWQRSKEKAGIIRVAQQAIAANEWVDPSSEDIQQDGPALAQFAGDKMVEADRLRAAAVITVGLQQAVGTAAMGFLNSGMNSPSRLRTVTPPGQTPVRQLPGVVPLRPAPANDNNVPLTRPAANGN